MGTSPALAEARASVRASRMNRMSVSIFGERIACSMEGFTNRACGAKIHVRRDGGIVLKVHEETTALGLFGVTGLIVFSLTIYFGFGLHRIGILFGLFTVAFAGLILSVVRMQRSKKHASRLR